MSLRRRSFLDVYSQTRAPPGAGLVFQDAHKVGNSAEVSNPAARDRTVQQREQ